MVSTASVAPQRTISGWGAVGIGAAAALGGLLPWLVTGMRLPLQNLWAVDAAPDELPLVLLPFSQYALTLIIGLLITGAALGGLLARAGRARLRKGGAWGILAGVLAVQLIAVAQTAIAVRAGLQERDESALYLAALVGVAVLSIACGVLVMLLIAKAPRAGAVIGLSIAALALGPWISGLFGPFGSVPPDAVVALLGAVRWVPPVLVGLAIAWGGVNTVGRALAAGVGLLLVWIVPALTTGIGSAAGTRVLAGYPAEMLEYGVQVLIMAATMPGLALPPIVLTVVVAAAGLTVRALAPRVRRRAPVSGAGPR